MKRRGFKWIWLFLGVVLISGSCGFGYEAKATQTRFEVAKDAFAKKDWETVIENLSDTSDVGRPDPKSFATFLHTYVDNELSAGRYELVSRKTKSSLVPINNEFWEYRSLGEPRPPLVTLRYVDDALWFDIPLSPKRVGMFRGKLVNMSFVSCFYRVCRANYLELPRKDAWKSVKLFVGSEKNRLTEMGISPKHLYSQQETWDKFIEEYEQRMKEWQKSRRT